MKIQSWHAHPSCFMEKVSDTECKLERDHPYYAQVQGQLGVTGAKWCDYRVYWKGDLH